MGKVLTEDQWIADYRPKPAPKPGNGFDFGNGCTLITGYNDGDIAYLEGVDQNTVWTVVDDGESTAIAAGRHGVNRLGYIVTEKPWESDMDEVQLEDLTDHDEDELEEIES